MTKKTDYTTSSVIDKITDCLMHDSTQFTYELIKEAKTKGTYGAAKKWLNSITPDWMNSPNSTGRSIQILISSICEDAYKELNKASNDQKIE